MATFSVGMLFVLRCVINVGVIVLVSADVKLYWDLVGVLSRNFGRVA